MYSSERDTFQIRCFKLKHCILNSWCYLGHQISNCYFSSKEEFRLSLRNIAFQIKTFISVADLFNLTLLLHFISGIC